MDAFFPITTATTTIIAVTGFQTKDDESRRIFNGLIEKYDTYIMPGSKPGFYRVSHMGLQTEEDLTLLAERIYQTEITWKRLQGRRYYKKDFRRNSC